jgi:phenylpropionate dioxygenase-like ring-hydroxylating dioxygenase large terminal subunit
MIADKPIKEQAQKTAIVPRLEGNPEFNWKHCWYPVTFVQDLPKERPYSFSLYDEPLVLFKNQDGKLGCLTDYCPHRAARLSDGQIIEGKLECLYHGWQFGTDGQCLNIPQLPADAKIPTKACVKSFPTVERQGIVWVWSGEPEAADIDRIPTVDVLDKPGFVYATFLLGQNLSSLAGSVT